MDTIEVPGNALVEGRHFLNPKLNMQETIMDICETPEEGKVYRGEIIDQLLTRSAQSDPQLVLTVRLNGRLKNEKYVPDGVEAFAALEREVRLTFVAENFDRLKMTLRDLERLGFKEDDIGRLHPDHPEFFSLVDQEIYVRLKVANDHEYWNLTWPADKPKSVKLEQLAADAEAMKPKIAAARMRMKEGRDARSATPAAMASASTTAADQPF